MRFLALVLCLGCGSSPPTPTPPSNPTGSGSSAQAAPPVPARKLIPVTTVPWPDWSRVSFAALGGGMEQSIAQAISADATTVVGSVVNGNLDEPVRWRAGKLEPLDFPPDSGGAQALVPSANGDVIAGKAATVKGLHLAGAIWHGTAAAVLDQVAGLDSWVVEAISGDGKIVVGVGAVKCGDRSCGRTVRWDATSKAKLVASSGGTEQLALSNVAMSADGNVLAGVLSVEVPEAVRVEGGRVDKLGPTTTAFGISHDGKVIVGAVGPRAAAWRGTKLIDLGLLPGFAKCDARASSGDGSRIVGNCRRPPKDTTEPRVVPFVWDQQRGMRALPDVLAEAKIDLAGWQLEETSSICARGVSIVGNGTHDGKTEAWIAIVPR